MDHQRAWWGLFMHTAVPYGWVWMTEDGGAASSWIPPGKPELSAEDESQVEPLLRLGFVQVGEFAAPGGEPTVGCMWRDARGET